MAVRQQTNLVQRGKSFYFHKKVPQDLRDHYGCESLRKNLRQFSALAEAKREAARLAAAYEVEVTSLRGKRGTPPSPLTIDLIPSLVEKYEAMQLAGDDVWRGRGLSDDEFHGMQEALAVQLPEPSFRVCERQRDVDGRQHSRFPRHSARRCHR
ncbi:DUF6538 domain-containing protein [Rhizobacter sp. Root29]|uniref:DUF6538 domain-containing protein n=1 Tax=unclassified Rhizobacter TaxID=2640088 RepID=UPI003515D1ED